jgi:hypothetical protein
MYSLKLGTDNLIQKGNTHYGKYSTTYRNAK